MAGTQRGGRRPGPTATRAVILGAAREMFAARGFGGTSLRAVAAQAGVDPALVSHYFTNKEGLFSAALELPFDAEALLADLAASTRETAPARFVEALLEVWDDPRIGPAMVGVLRRALAESAVPGGTRGLMEASLLARAGALVLREVDPAEAHTRMALVATQMLGIAITRKVLRVEPIASMTVTELSSAVAPTIARYLYGEDIAALPDHIPYPHDTSKGTST